MLDERTSQGKGMKRLSIMECLRLLVDEEVVLVIPLVTRNTPHDAREPRRRLRESFGRVVLSASAIHHLSAQEQDAYLDDEFRQRTVQQCGQDHIEFNVKISTYPERALLDQPNPRTSDINRWLGADNAGLYLEALGYGSPREFCCGCPIFPTSNYPRSASMMVRSSTHLTNIIVI